MPKISPCQFCILVSFERQNTCTPPSLMLHFKRVEGCCVGCRLSRSATKTAIPVIQMTECSCFSRASRIKTRYFFARTTPHFCCSVCSQREKNEITALEKQKPYDRKTSVPYLTRASVLPSEVRVYSLRKSHAACPEKRACYRLIACCDTFNR